MDFPTRIPFSVSLESRGSMMPSETGARLKSTTEAFIIISQRGGINTFSFNMIRNTEGYSLSK